MLKLEKPEVSDKVLCSMYTKDVLKNQVNVLNFVRLF